MFNSPTHWSFCRPYILKLFVTAAVPIRRLRGWRIDGSAMYAYLHSSGLLKMHIGHISTPYALTTTPALSVLRQEHSTACPSETKHTACPWVKRPRVDYVTCNPMARTCRLEQSSIINTPLKPWPLRNHLYSAVALGIGFAQDTVLVVSGYTFRRLGSLDVLSWAGSHMSGLCSFPNDADGPLGTCGTYSYPIP